MGKQKMTKVLIIDDDQFSREIFVDTLSGLLDIEITQCDSGKDALELLAGEHYDIIFSDIKMPGMSGIELLKEYKKLSKSTLAKFVLFTGFATIDTAIKALREGAHDYLLKPLDIRRVIEIIKEHKNSPASPENSEGDRQRYANKKKGELNSILLNGSYMMLDGIGRVGMFSEQLKEAVKVAMKLYEKPEVSVLIQGETGTGKEVFAHILHHGTGINEKPFIRINCSDINPNLFDSDLFGYTSNSSSRKVMPGLLDAAAGGTILFDEIGDMPEDLQPKLIRILQDRFYYRVGGFEKVELNARIIATSNKQLDDMADRGKFRRDLLHRLKQGWIYLPPLREQVESIPLFAQLFLNESSTSRNRMFKFISPAAVEIMQNYQWSGNIRELKNIIDRIAMLYDEFELNASHLGFLRSAQFGYKSISQDKFALKIDNFELPEDELDFNLLQTEIVRMALEKYSGSKSKAARYLKVSLSTLKTLQKRNTLSNVGEG